jgi:hypothetical protein
MSNNEKTNSLIERLRKTEGRARAINEMRYVNESKWDELYDAARNTPEWSAYCESRGISKSYNYGDVIC